MPLNAIEIRTDTTWDASSVAGVAAAMAVRNHIPVQDVSIPVLQARLKALGQILEL